jgi:hypothetical protein
MISSQYSRSEKKALNPTLDEFHLQSDRNGLVNQLSSHVCNGTTKASRRRFPSSLSSKTNHKVVLEVPLQYSFANGRKDVPGKHEGWRLRQMSRLSLNSSFPIVATPLRYQNNAQTQDYISSLLRNVTCQVAASTAIRGRTGYSTGSIQMQYRHPHNFGQRPQFITQTPENLRWISTLTAGIGVQQLENNNQESDTPAGVNASRALPFPAFHLGCSTSFTRTESSTSTSFSANVQTPKFSSVVLPLTVSNQQRIKLQSSKARDLTRSLDIRTQCTTIFDFSTHSSKLTVPTINATLSFSPTVKMKGVTFCRKDRRVLQYWSLLLGLNSQKGDVKPVLGVSMTLQLPKLVRSLWETAIKRVSNNLLDVTLQWKGGPSWQIIGWWTQKHISNSRKTNPLPQRPIRQLGVGVTFNHGFSRRGSSSKHPFPSSPLGILSWIFTWTEGDFTVRIPILLADIALDSIWYHQGFQVFYLSFL